MRLLKKESINFHNTDAVILNLIQKLNKIKISTLTFVNSEWFEITAVVIAFTIIISSVAMLLRTIQ